MSDWKFHRSFGIAFFFPLLREGKLILGHVEVHRDAVTAVTGVFKSHSDVMLGDTI